MFCFFFFKQKTAYEVRFIDWSSDVCSSDLCASRRRRPPPARASPRAAEVCPAWRRIPRLVPWASILAKLIAREEPRCQQGAAVAPTAKLSLPGLTRQPRAAVPSPGGEGAFVSRAHTPTVFARLDPAIQGRPFRRLPWTLGSSPRVTVFSIF